MDYTIPGIFQARILEWVAFPFSRGSFQPRDWTQVSCTAGGFFSSWATREAHRVGLSPFYNLRGTWSIKHCQNHKNRDSQTLSVSCCLARVQSSFWIQLPSSNQNRRQKRDGSMARVCSQQNRAVGNFYMSTALVPQWITWDGWWTYRLRFERCINFFKWTRLHCSA